MTKFMWIWCKDQALSVGLSLCWAPLYCFMLFEGCSDQRCVCAWPVSLLMEYSRWLCGLIPFAFCSPSHATALPPWPWSSAYMEFGTLCDTCSPKQPQFKGLYCYTPFCSGIARIDEWCRFWCRSHPENSMDSDKLLEFRSSGKKSLRNKVKRKRFQVWLLDFQTGKNCAGGKNIQES